MLCLCCCLDLLMFCSALFFLLHPAVVVVVVLAVGAVGVFAQQNCAMCFFSKCRRMYTRATHIAFDTKGERWFCNWVHIYIRFTNILTDFHFTLLLISFIFALLTAFHAMATISFHFFVALFTFIVIVVLSRYCFVKYSCISSVLCAYMCVARCIWNLNIHKRVQFFCNSFRWF